MSEEGLGGAINRTVRLCLWQGLEPILLLSLSTRPVLSCLIAASSPSLRREQA